MDNNDSFGIGTNCLYAGYEPDSETGSVPPLYQTMTYDLGDTDRAERLLSLEEEGDAYSRISNPTNGILEDRIATLEGGVGAIATTSGMASIDLATTILAEAGDNIVTSNSLFGNTYTYFNYTLDRRGVDIRFVDTLDYEAYEEAIDEDTAYVHLETIGNPSLDTPDIERVADIAHDGGVPLVVDNTFATPVLCRPIEHGADIVWESSSKWLHGSGSTMGGLLIDSGNFPWGEYSEKFPEVAGDNPAYHGRNFYDEFGEEAFIRVAAARGLRDIGNQQSHFDAWVTLQKMESLPHRMEKHCENALAAAEYLQNHDAIKEVTYPGLESHPTHENAAEYLEDGFGGMLVFRVEGGPDFARDVIDELEVVNLISNVGDAKSLIIHPSSTTHKQMSPEQRRDAGVTDDLIRMSVGIEDTDDIIGDLEQALEAASE